jgi:hypothetical protein
VVVEDELVFIEAPLASGSWWETIDLPGPQHLVDAVVQTTWRKSHEQIVDWVATNETLGLALGFTQRTPLGKLQTISKGQYWERRQALCILPFVFFFLALVA